MNLTNDDVQEILHLLAASSSNEFHLHTERFKLAVRRAGDGLWVQSSEVLSAPKMVGAVSEAPVVPTSVATPLAVDNMIDVRAPLVGHFYRAAKPGAPPFVEVGSRVDETTVVAIIETMKLLNSVYAGATGTVVEIFPQNGQFVEQDAVLIRLDPEAPK